MVTMLRYCFITLSLQLYCVSLFSVDDLVLHFIQQLHQFTIAPNAVPIKRARVNVMENVMPTASDTVMVIPIGTVVMSEKHYIIGAETKDIYYY